MQYNTRDGAPRLLQACSLPLTAPGCVKRVYTDIAVVEVRVEGFVAIEIISSISAEDLRARTGAPITIADGCRPLVAPVIEG